MRAIREYYWLIEPMMGVGFNLVDTKFTNVILKNNSSPDFAELVYGVHRCSHTHGDEVPVEYTLLASENAFVSYWEFGPNAVRMPDKIIWGLTAVAVFSRVNYRFKGAGGACRLSWGEEIYPISEWWGREADLKPIAAGWNTTRVQFEELHRLKSADPKTAETSEVLIIAAPPSKSDQKS